MVGAQDMLNPDVLAQMVQQNDEKHDEGHHRLRTDLRALESRVTSLEASRLDQETRVRTLDMALRRVETEPTDVTNLNFPPRVVVSIVAVCFTVFGGIWASTYGLRSDVRDILTRQSEQQKLDTANATLIAERAAMLRQAVDMIEKKQELQRLEIQNLRETILRQRNP